MMALVKPEELADSWAKVEHWISQAVSCNQGDENLLDVLISLARGHYELWHDPGQFAAVVRIEHWPRQRVATIIYLGGRGLGAIEEAFEQARGHAKARKIDVLRVFGRKGWEKLLGLQNKGAILQVPV